MEKLNVGLVKGRHSLPVDMYIFDEVKDVLDFETIQKIADEFVANNCKITKRYCNALNQSDYSDIECYIGEVELNVYVTGLTACTASIIKSCAVNGVKLILHHYDFTTKQYKKQIIF